MEVHIHSALDAHHRSALSEQILGLDPAAVIDLAPNTSALRISTVLTHKELMQQLHSIGLTPAQHEVEVIPSVCCGGCSG